jgi:hypothetical protein
MMENGKIDRRKNNGGHSTAGKAGAKPKLINPKKMTITFNGVEADALLSLGGGHNLFLRELVAKHFGLDSPLTANFEALAFDDNVQ